MTDFSPNQLVSDLVRPHTPVGKQRAGQAIPDDEALIRGLQELPELVTFTGIFAGQFDDPAGLPDAYQEAHDAGAPAPATRKWSLLFFDAKLTGWLLIEPGGVVRRKRFAEPASSGVMRDVIWVRADASVKRGERPQSIQGQFLQGEFTKAGDFAASVSGGTVSASTGIFCDAQTPNCCGPRTRP